MPYRIMVVCERPQNKGGWQQRQDIEYRVASALELFDRLMKCRNRYRILRFYLLPRDMRKNSDAIIACVDEWKDGSPSPAGGGFWITTPSNPDELEELASRVWEAVARRGNKYPGIYEL